MSVSLSWNIGREKKSREQLSPIPSQSTGEHLDAQVAVLRCSILPGLNVVVVCNEQALQFYYDTDSTRIAVRFKNGASDLVFFLFADNLGSTKVTNDPNGLTPHLRWVQVW
jgi:hypothetical protein